MRAIETAEGIAAVLNLSQEAPNDIQSGRWTISKLTADFLEDYQSNLENPRVLLIKLGTLEFKKSSEYEVEARGEIKEFKE